MRAFSSDSPIKQAYHPEKLHDCEDHYLEDTEKIID